MSNDAKVVKIKEIHSQEFLWQGTMDELPYAYEYAAKLEEMGLEIELIAPTLTQSLVNNLGLNASEKEEYEQSVFDEIHDHEGSCCHDEKKGLKP